jgi:hypothetical protein
VRPRLRTLKLFSISIYLIVWLAFIHEMNSFIADDILIVAVLYVYLSEVLAVVTLSLGKHAPFLVIGELLLQFACILVELHIGAQVWVVFRKEADAVSLPHNASHSLVTVVVILQLVFII